MRHHRNWFRRRGSWASAAALAFSFGAAWWISVPTLAGEEEEHQEKSAVVHTPEGETLLKIDAGHQHELEISVAPLAAYQYKPEVCAVGRLEEDPAKSFVLRAPLAGVISVAEVGAWVRIGDSISHATILGWIEPRLGPLEQVDLASRYAAAKSELAQAQADLAVAQASFESKRALNTDNKIVTDRALEEARAKVAGQQARLAAAGEIVHLIEAAQGAHGPTPANQLRVELGGEVVELAAQVGESVDRGQVLLKTAKHDTLLARVELPVGVAFEQNVTSARIVALDDETASLSAQRVAQAPRTAGTAAGALLLYRLETKGKPLRPGTRVLAFVPTSAEPEPGVIIPRAAVVRDSGRAWVYVQTAADTFARREVPTLAPTHEGWFVASGFAVAEKIVIDGAQMLLSEELKPQIEKEEASEE